MLAESFLNFFFFLFGIGTEILALILGLAELDRLWNVSLIQPVETTIKVEHLPSSCQLFLRFSLSWLFSNLCTYDIRQMYLRRVAAIGDTRSAGVFCSLMYFALIAWLYWRFSNLIFKKRTLVCNNMWTACPHRFFLKIFYGCNYLNNVFIAIRLWFFSDAPIKKNLHTLGIVSFF